MNALITKDSIENISNGYFKSNQSGSNQTTSRGRIRKGPVVSNFSIPTIPSKYFTVITENDENKGFHQSSKRFQYNYTDTPGPGSYGDVVELSQRLKKTSDSKNGLGGFASRSSRSEVKLNPNFTPGAGSYNVETSTQLKTRQDFSSGYSSAFQPPIAQRVEKENDQIPAPNSYNISKNIEKHVYKSNNVCADSAFKSNTKRDIYGIDQNKDIPAPNKYNVNDEPVHASNKISYHSSFKSTSQRGTFMPSSDIPAPNYYRPNEPILENINRQLFPRRAYLAISAPAVTMNYAIPAPGPGAYEVRDFREPEKKYMSSAAFVSSTGRFNATSAYNQNLNPGPANYSPSKPTKQSFLYNSIKKWV